MLTEFTTIVIALIGVSGGFLLYQEKNRLTNRSELRERTCEKLENAYLLAIEVEKWGLSSLTTLILEDSISNNDLKSKTSQIVFLTSCYGNNCVEKARSLELTSAELLHKHLTLHFEHKREFIEENDPYYELLEDFKQLYETFSEKINELKELLIIDVRKNK